MRLKHIKTVRTRLADGRVKVYYYHRLTGRRIRGEPGTPEFLESYAAAAAPSGPPPGTVAALIYEYRRSDAFARLAPRTQSDYLKILDKIQAEFGDAPIRAFSDSRIRQDIRAWRQRLAERSPRQADYAVSVLRTILELAVDDGRLPTNPASRIGKVYRANRADKIWQESDIEAFLAVASPELRLAMRLALDTGQRQGDLLRLPWSAYDGQAIRLRQRKTGRRVYIPLTRLLAAELAQAPRRATTILTTSRGRPWTADGFRTSWRKAAQKAGVTGLTFHDLRGTAVTRLFEAGCEAGEIATITGHSLSSVENILDTYMARTKRLAERAIERLEAARRRNET